MLQESNKPQVLRLHNLQQKQRNSFCSSFNMAISQLLPSTLLRKLKSSPYLSQLTSALPDIYYTLVTVNYCRRRLGQQYTYIAMYKQKHYEEEGVLLNKKVRLLLFVLEIVTRNLTVPLLFKLAQANSDINEKEGGIEGIRKRIGTIITQYLGGAQTIVSNVSWFVLMLYMLGWNKHFNIIQTLLGIRYVYTYKNDQLKDISYKIEGWLILISLVVKAGRHIHSLYQTSLNKRVQGVSKSERNDGGQRQAGRSKGEQLLCRVCYDDMKCRSATRCGHVFCWSCIIKTLEMSAECPVCRAACQPRQVVQLRNY